MTLDDQTIADGSCQIVYQKPTIIKNGDVEGTLFGRTFEEAFVYDNMQLFRSTTITATISLPPDIDLDRDYASVFDTVNSRSFKKTDFAMDVVASDAAWKSPKYIADGLAWLEKKLSRNVAEETVQ
jgi:hypothetical protein